MHCHLRRLGIDTAKALHVEEIETLQDHMLELASQLLLLLPPVLKRHQAILARPPQGATSQ
eukprot:1435625-Prorocentrum_lima.AAC.1